jgi:DNA-binding phage protein
MYGDNQDIQAFLYLKEENEEISDVSPVLPNDRYLKIGTFKINAHGTKLGERLIKKAFDYALDKKIKKIYLTVFPEHGGEPDTARLILRDLVNATVGFETLAKATAKQSKSLHRMLSAKGNPTMDNLTTIFSVLRQKLDVDIEVHAVRH